MTVADIQVNGFDEGLEAKVRDHVRRALATGRPGGPGPDRIEVSVTNLDVARMRALNREYHGVDAATDVLTFELGALEDGEAGSSLLGDVYVCGDVAGEQARELGIDPGEEMLRLVVHGVLHLLGHEHPAGPAREDSDMFRLQERLLRP